MAYSDASTKLSEVPKRKREVSVEEKEKTQARRDVSLWLPSFTITYPTLFCCVAGHQCIADLCSS